MVQSLRMSDYRVWTDEESVVLKEAAGSLSLRELAERLPGRTVASIRFRCRQQGIPFRDARKQLKGVPRSVWTEERVEWLREQLAADRMAKDIAKDMGVPEHSVRGAMTYYGIAGRGRSAPKREEFEALLAEQGGVCAVCHEPETREVDGAVFAYSVDHDHSCCPGRKTCGKCTRGLLCSSCNYMLGKLEQRGVLEAAMEYLAKYRDKVH